MADNEEQQQTDLPEETPPQMEQTASDEVEGADGAGDATNGQADENGADEKPKTEEDDDDDDSDDDEDERKLFVGGLSWETQESGLKDYMTQYGEVTSCTVKTDQQTGRSRCFGFVVFQEVAGLDKALEARPHKVDGRKIDSKKAEPQKREGKLFVGGVKPDTEDETIREYFAQYGKILKIDRPKDQTTKKPKAFCFITFKKDGAVSKITKQRYHQLDGKDVECKYADPPYNERGPGGGGRGRGRGRGYGGQGFGGFGYGGGPFPGAYGGGFGNFGGGFQGGFGGGAWGSGPGFGPYGGGAFGGGGGFGGGYGGGYGYGGGQSSFGKAGRGGRHQNNFKPY